ncbi:MAG: ATP-binding protein [Pseudomonadota bacterium]
MNSPPELGSHQGVLLDDLMHPPFMLFQLSVFNWGSFSRLHQATIDTNGTAVIGPTGSGKTTLVDALMTLLCPRPSYNLASTGGHESDRDLMSYVRGVAGAGDGSGGTSHISRPGKTVTAIEATLASQETSDEASEGRKLRALGILWLDSSSSAMVDLKRLWICAENTDVSIEDWLEIHRDGGMRALKARARETKGVHAWENKKSYLAQLRRFFDVGENAFTLLNRASGLKQINSIDELFRSLVLDDSSVFDRAGEVVSEFDDLTAIHQELEIARKQQRSLAPIENEEKQRQVNIGRRLTEERLRAALPCWFAEHGHRLWTEEQQRADIEYGRCLKSKDAVTQRVAKHTELIESLHAAYLRLGGSSIEDLQERLREQRTKMISVESDREDFARLASGMELDVPRNEQEFLAARTKLKSLNEELQSGRLRAEEELFAKGAQLSNLRDQLLELERERERIAASDSNIPGPYLEFRETLAEVLNIAPQDIPFAAELVEVKSEEREWRGAIERAFGSDRLRILLPQAAIRNATAWVNSRNNRLHVRLLEVKDRYEAARFFDDGFTRKLNFKNHPAREAVKHLLARLDRHCKNNSDELHGESHAMTREGLMTGRRGFYDKQDHRPLNKNWMTGFDNRDRLQSLENDIDQVRSERAQYEQALERYREERDRLGAQITRVGLLQNVRFEAIDLDSVTQLCERLQNRLNAALLPDSETAGAKAAWEQAKSNLETLDKEREALGRRIGALQARSKTARQQVDALRQRVGDGLKPEQRELADAQFKVPALETLEASERAQRSDLDEQLAKTAARVSNNERELARLMERAQREDTGALSEVGTELADVSAYLERLKQLNEEDLPEKLNRFREYLKQSSTQGVDQLLMSVKNEVDRIREKIDDLNATMRIVDFKPQQYIRLDPRDLVHESLRSLRKAQQRWRSATTVDEEGESEYKALQQIVEMLRDACERRRTRGALALLDPRYRLEFSASVIRREEGTVVESLKGSQGGSGGEKEIIASYILTASLSYALCPDGLSKPLFSTVVLDEAFSRSSQAVAGRIIAALREFGLHPLFVTPNKEIKLLREHTRSAVVVHNHQGSSCLACMSWQELDKKAREHRDQLISP